jgi:hypothetical protein
MTSQKKFESVYQLTMASTGLRLLAEKSNSKVERESLQLRAKKVEELTKVVADEIGSTSQINKDTVDFQISSAKEQSATFFREANANELPIMVQYFMKDVKAVEASRDNGNEKIMEDILG